MLLSKGEVLQTSGLTVTNQSVTIKARVMCEKGQSVTHSIYYSFIKHIDVSTSNDLKKPTSAYF